MKNKPIKFRYDDGTIIADNVEEPLHNFVWDKRVEKWRAMGIHYDQAVKYLREAGADYLTSVPRYKRIHPKLRLHFDLHFYQEEALKAWIDAGCQGSVVLPTGAGKSLLALKAIEFVERIALAIVPTIAAVGANRNL